MVRKGEKGKGKRERGKRCVAKQRKKKPKRKLPYLSSYAELTRDTVVDFDGQNTLISLILVEEPAVQVTAAKALGLLAQDGMFFIPLLFPLSFFPSSSLLPSPSPLPSSSSPSLLNTLAGAPHNNPRDQLHFTGARTIVEFLASI